MSSYKEGQIHQLADKLEEAGVTPEEITKLAQSNVLLAQVQDLVNGQAQVVYTDHFIDCDADPITPLDGWQIHLIAPPAGWQLEEHIKGGQFVFNLGKVALWLSKYQQKDSVTNGEATGCSLRDELKDQPVLNACVLDWLLEHTELIPSRWKGKAIFFWGTIYRCSRGLCVRCLYWDWDDKKWCWRGQLIDDRFLHPFPSNYPAAVSVSN